MLQKFCCCCDLKTGTISIAIFGLFFSSISVLACSLRLNEDAKLEQDYYIYMDTTRTGESLAASIANVILFGLLLYGALMERRFFMMPFLVIDGILTALVTILIVLVMFSGALQIPVLIVGLLLCGIASYVWVCVFSYYQDLNPNNPHRSNEKVEAGPTEITTLQVRKEGTGGYENLDKAIQEF